ncbi:hypothetical protein HYV88_01525 [Candidatus Woesearchaeota archaeon]|nr:hypothetical protein [Candidatus Woesearchaeota archaeon]
MARCADCDRKVGGLFGRAGYTCDRCGCDICGNCVNREDGEDYCKRCWANKSGRGCFIATAAYGTPFSEEINVLRDWRDKSLITNNFGRLFVKTYYRFSPPIAQFIENKEGLKKAVRVVLNPYIKFLKNKGYNKRDKYTTK